MSYVTAKELEIENPVIDVHRTRLLLWHWVQCGTWTKIRLGGESVGFMILGLVMGFTERGTDGPRDFEHTHIRDPHLHLMASQVWLLCWILITTDRLRQQLARVIKGFKSLIDYQVSSINST